jgi:hypothetical protein
VSAGTGGVSLAGASKATNDSNMGVVVDQGALVTATQTGAVVIEGTGSASGTSFNRGVYISGTNTLVSTDNGNVSITGTGAGTGNANAGILIVGLALVNASQNGDLTLTGTGGTGTDSNSGISLDNQAVVRAALGSLSVKGTGNGSGANNIGITTTNGALFTRSGMGPSTFRGIVGTLNTPGIGSAGNPVLTTLHNASTNFNLGFYQGFFQDTGGIITLGTLTVFTTKLPANTGALNVTGSVILDASSRLSLSLVVVGDIGSVFTLIHTTGAVSGQFPGQPEGSIISLDGIRYRISYLANAGTDVTLTRVA